MEVDIEFGRIKRMSDSDLKDVNCPMNIYLVISLELYTLLS